MSELDKKLFLKVIDSYMPKNVDLLKSGRYPIVLDNIEYECRLPQHLVRYMTPGKERFQAFNEEAFGEGAQGSVFEGSAFRFWIEDKSEFQFKQNKTERCVKIEPLSFLTDGQDKLDAAKSSALAQFAAETEINEKESKKPAFFVDGTKKSFSRVKVMHRQSGCTLGTLLRSEEYQTQFSLSESVSFMLELAKDLKRYHDKVSIHYDIKPENIMINIENGKIRLIDLDTMEKENVEAPSRRDRATEFYAAPEAKRELTQLERVVRQLPKITVNNPPKQICKIDIYPLGRVFEEMLNNLNKNTKASYANEEKNIRDLIKTMLAEDQEIRKDIKHVITVLEEVDNTLILNDFRSLQENISEFLSEIDQTRKADEKAQKPDVLPSSPEMVARNTLINGLENSLLTLGAEINVMRKTNQFTRQSYSEFYTRTYNLMNDARELFKNKNIVTKFFNGLTRPISFIVFGIVSAVKKENTTLKQELYHKEGFWHTKDAELIYNARRNIEKIQENSSPDTNKVHQL